MQRQVQHLVWNKKENPPVAYVNRTQTESKNVSYTDKCSPGILGFCSISGVSSR